MKTPAAAAAAAEAKAVRGEESDPLLMLLPDDEAGPSPSSSPSSDAKKTTRSSSWTTGRRIAYDNAAAAAAILLLGISACIFMALLFASGPFAVEEDAAAAAVVGSSPPLRGGRRRHYEATQLVSFTINTMGGVADKGECEGRQIDPNYGSDEAEGEETGGGTCYLGNANNLTDDLRHRFAILRDVVATVRADRMSDDPEIDHSSKVLKVVMLPEFFLRGPYGAYNMSSMLPSPGGGSDGSPHPVMMQLSDAVKDLVDDPDLEHYLFVMGTVIFARSSSDPNTLAGGSRLEAGHFEYWNFCVVYRGGPGGRKSVVPKQYISKVDFLSRTVLPNPARTEIGLYASLPREVRELWDSRGTAVVEDNVINVDGIRIGIEICLDHRLGALWEKLRETGGPLVDVLLVTSAGMAIERGPNPVVPGGVVYLTDGEASSAACIRTDRGQFDPDKVCREPGPGGIKHVPASLSRSSSEFLLLSGCVDFLGKTDLLKGYYSIYQTQGCAYTLKLYGINVMDEYKYYPPSIEIYPVVALPEDN